MVRHAEARASLRGSPQHHRMTSTPAVCPFAERPRRTRSMASTSTGPQSSKQVTVQLVGGHNSASSNPEVWSARRRRRSMTRGARL
jgi:hypothetical protein